MATHHGEFIFAQKALAALTSYILYSGKRPCLTITNRYGYYSVWKLITQDMLMDIPQCIILETLDTLSQ